MKKVLVVITSHDKLGNTGEKTGFWLEELAAPYYAFKDAGIQMTLASPAGGQPPLDPTSNQVDFQTDDTRRFEADKEATQALATTKRLSDVSEQDFDAIFYPGGHGPLWDLRVDSDSIDLIQEFYANNKPVAAVCHAPAVLLNVKDSSGSAIVAGKRVTGFSNSEEAAVELTDVVPVLVEDGLAELGGKYSKGDDWESYTVEDGLLLTGQNPASSRPLANILINKLQD